MILKKSEVRIESAESGCFLVMTRRQSEIYGIKPTMQKRISLYQNTFNKVAKKHLLFNS